MLELGAAPRHARRSAPMEALDRAPWRAGLVVAPFGKTIGVRTNDPTVVERLGTLLLLPPWADAPVPTVQALLSFWHGAPPSWRGRRNYHLLAEHHKTVVRSLDVEEALRELRRRFQVQVALTAPPRLHFVHAGVVEWRGQALILPARQRAGKSHLVAALVERGAGFVSDTFAVVGSDGLARLSDGGDGIYTCCQCVLVP